MVKNKNKTKPEKESAHYGHKRKVEELEENMLKRSLDWIVDTEDQGQSLRKVLGKNSIDIKPLFVRPRMVKHKMKMREDPQFSINSQSSKKRT